MQDNHAVPIIETLISLLAVKWRFVTVDKHLACMHGILIQTGVHIILFISVDVRDWQ